MPTETTVARLCMCVPAMGVEGGGVTGALSAEGDRPRLWSLEWTLAAQRARALTCPAEGLAGWRVQAGSLGAGWGLQAFPAVTCTVDGAG